MKSLVFPHLLHPPLLPFSRRVSSLARLFLASHGLGEFSCHPFLFPLPLVSAFVSSSVARQRGEQQGFFSSLLPSFLSYSHGPRCNWPDQTSLSANDLLAAGCLAGWLEMAMGMDTSW